MDQNLKKRSLTKDLKEVELNFRPPSAVLFREMYSARVTERKYVAKTSLFVAPWRGNQ